MQRSALIREELEDTVAGMSPAARAVFEDIKSRDENAEPEFPEDFDALTPIERTNVTKAVEHLKGLAQAEAAKDPAEDLEHPKGVSRRHRHLWLGSVLISLACLLAVGGISVSVYTAPTRPDPADTVVSTPDEVTRYLGAHVPAPVHGAKPPVFIPTGLYIESIEFSGPYTVEVSGQIWQRYANDLPKDLTQGVFLPEAKVQPTLKEVYQEQRRNEEVTGWTFHATLREQFDYSSYPLGRHQIKLRMWHPDYQRNVYLTPDLGAYASLDPAAMPGVDPALVLENWDIQQAFFSYRTHRYNTDFGTTGYVTDQLHPELYYSIAVKRELVTPFISRTIVPLVILVLLFVVVTVLSRNLERLDDFGVRPGAVVFTGAALFFAVLVGHNSLRDEVKAPGLIYIESLYIMTYFVILAVAFNSVLLVGRPNLRLFRDYDNLWVRVLYWPVIWFTLLVVTLLTFCI
jgi:hypothetical protein